MNKKILFFIMMYSFATFSQKARGVAGVGLFRNVNFEKAIYVSLNAGFEYRVNTILKPEIEFNFYIGSIRDQSKYDANGNEVSLILRNVSAKSFAFCPKINFGDFGDKIFLQILPIYSFTIINATAASYAVNQNNTNLLKTDSDTTSDQQHSLGLGIGVLFELNKDDKQSLAVNLIYTNLDLSNALNKLKFNISTQKFQTLGIQVKYYFSFKKSKNL